MVGAESRSHTRSLGAMCRRYFSALSFTPCAVRSKRALSATAWLWQRISTRSKSLSARTISAYTHGIGPSFPGQSGSWCGHAIQVASCGSHSAGNRYVGVILSAAKDLGASRAEVTAEDRRVRIDAPVTQERPVAARILDDLRIALRDENLR